MKAKGSLMSAILLRTDSSSEYVVCTESPSALVIHRCGSVFCYGCGSSRAEGMCRCFASRREDLIPLARRRL
uniref:Uncharacterized protein n=1 Tax=Hordeum vulgare subsp. vulgare TaxID=112509 RepID=A0A8I6XSH7_HORVV